jgi:non-ribosomal peptide synthetase component F
MNNVYEIIKKNGYRGIAVVDDNSSISYRDLFNFCEGMRERFSHLQKDDCVIIYAKKSVKYVNIMVAMLSIGVAYLSLDEHTPVEKVKHYSKLLNARYVFVDQPCEIENEIIISAIGFQKNNVEAHTHGGREYKDSDLAYMICTSGSSGEPKIVMIEHHSLINLVLSLNEKIYKNVLADRQLHIAVVASFSFDASVKQIFCSLCFGHTLYICGDKDKILGRKFLDFIKKNQIDVTDCTPTLISSIYADKKKAKDHCLKVIITGGEELLQRQINEVIEMFDHEIQLVNVYGPTECCVDATYYKVPMKTDGEINQKIPIGRPLDNVILELDNNELIIKGTSVGRGYFGKDDQGGFFTDEKGRKAYRTGDVCYEENGLYYLVGRVDNQEKINGFRVVPSIVDFELSKLCDVSFSVTFCIEFMKRKILCTVINSSLERKEVLSFLKKQVPDYCIPKFLIYIEENPVFNKNGKTDINYYKRIGRNYLDEVFAETLRGGENKKNGKNPPHYTTN